MIYFLTLQEDNDRTVEVRPTSRDQGHRSANVRSSSSHGVRGLTSASQQQQQQPEAHWAGKTKIHRPASAGDMKLLQQRLTAVSILIEGVFSNSVCAVATNWNDTLSRQRSRLIEKEVELIVLKMTEMIRLVQNCFFKCVNPAAQQTQQRAERALRMRAGRPIARRTLQPRRRLRALRRLPSRSLFWPRRRLWRTRSGDRPEPGVQPDHTRPPPSLQPEWGITCRLLHAPSAGSCRRHAAVNSSA